MASPIKIQIPIQTKNGKSNEKILMPMQKNISNKNKKTIPMKTPMSTVKKQTNSNCNSNEQSNANYDKNKPMPVAISNLDC